MHHVIYYAQDRLVINSESWIKLDEASLKNSQLVGFSIKK